jgi:glucoamylase
MNMSGNSVVFGAPGIEPRWTSSAKEGLGTAYHTSCRLWFTLSHGIVNEIYYPHVDQPNTRDFQFLISVGGPKKEDSSDAENHQNERVRNQ